MKIFEEERTKIKSWDFGFYGVVVENGKVEKNSYERNICLFIY